ncbi:double-strand break repair protein AddB [Bartonella sp. DGB1]|uniref:double-strand break repair protein AddB n=1 Tax=Bartonella sp. DGB1 TaxID=3239807 RepID=UPI00352606D3
MLKKQKVFSIPFGVDFLSQLADSLINNEIIDGVGELFKDPIKVSDITIYLPTHRAVRQLKEIFIQKNIGGSSFLPNIRALTDIDDNLIFFSDDQSEVLQLPPVIENQERLIELAKLIHHWYINLPDTIKQLYGSKELFLPSNFADCILIARDLAEFLDLIQSYEIEWDNLENINLGLSSEWWNLTWEFLSIISKYFPAILAEKNRLDPIDWRLKLLELERKRLTTIGKNNIVIAAGFMSLFPALDRFLKDISCLPNGAVILPAMDNNLDDYSWEKLNHTDTDNPAVFCHPQKSIYQLLTNLNMLRADVVELGLTSKQLLKRSKIVTEIFRPSDTTELWRDLDKTTMNIAVNDIAMLEAPNETEEAAAISLILRELLEDPKKKVALVCNDINLIRYVAGHLRKFNVIADNAIGQYLSDSPQGIFVNLLLEFIFNQQKIIDFLALCKHPFFHLGEERSKIRPKIAILEIALFREYLWQNDLEKYIKYLEEHLKNSDNEAERASLELLKKIYNIILPLINFVNNIEQKTIAEMTKITIQVVEELIKDSANNMEHFYGNESGEEFISFFKKLLLEKTTINIKSNEWGQVIAALWADIKVKPKSGGHPRLYIWDNLESRLQFVDAVVIAGMNETIWPSVVKNGSFLSRVMKMAINLPPPEQDIGIVAHDLQMLLATPQVYLTRSLRYKNEIKIASRWWQRLEAVVGENIAKQLKQKGDIYLYWVKQLNISEKIPRVLAPAPCPDVAVRPKDFSVTEIEILRDNPYAIYCKKILKLKPLPPLRQKFEARDRGILMHKIFAIFCENHHIIDKQQALSELLNIARIEFAKEDLPADLAFIWWDAFENIANDFLSWHNEQPNIKIFLEKQSKKVPIANTNVSLSCRVDRLDICNDNFAVIIDLKTGTSISMDKVGKLEYPQLLLEALIALQQGFPEVKIDKILDVVYLFWSVKGEFSVTSFVKKYSIEQLQDTLAEVEQELIWLLNKYNDPNSVYLSYSRPKNANYKNDYDHLARIDEWLEGLHND